MLVFSPSRPGLAERYERATNSADLTVRAAPGDPDVLIAVAWAHRKGAPLMRLASQWTDDHRRGPNAQPAERVAALRDLPLVRCLVIAHAMKWRMPDPAATAAAVLRYWLDPVCNCCHGTRFELIAGTHQQSRIACRACQGTGRQTPPCGADGARLLHYLDSCRGRAHQGIRTRLRD